MKEFGAILLVLGLSGIYFFQYEFDTSITIEPGRFNYSQPYNPKEKDGNIGLLQDKRNYTLGSVGVTTIGAVLLITGLLRKKRYMR
jgi:hypothetical protein